MATQTVGVFSRHIKKWNRRFPASPYTEWQEKKFQKKLFKIEICIEKSANACLSSHRAELGPSKIDMVVIQITFI